MDLFQDRCRLCLVQSSNLLYIFDGKKNIFEELSVCLSMNISSDDNLPKYICSKCANTLHKFHGFYTNSKRCEEILLSYINDDLASTSKKDSRLEIEKYEDGNEEVDLSTETLFFANLLDDSKSSFDGEILQNDLSAMPNFEYLDEDDSDPNNLTQALLLNGAKLTKIANVIKKSSDDSPSDSIEIHMEMDVLDPDLDTIDEVVVKEIDKNIASSSENYACMSCKSSFYTFDLLIKHMEVCEYLKKTCPECGEKFGTYGQMKKHLFTHNFSEDNSPPENCPHCGKNFQTKCKLKQHIEGHHSDPLDDGNNIFRCKKCRLVFKLKSELYAHVKTHIKSKSKATRGNFNCDKCNQTYSNLSNFKNHVRLKHNNVEVYKCKICSVLFTDRSKLYSHIKQHTDVLGDCDHLCDSCGMSFNRAKDLLHHAQIHKDKNNLKCDVCLKQCVDKSALEMHLLTHNSISQMCEICGLTFMNENLLNTHKIKNHQLQMIS